MDTTCMSFVCDGTASCAGMPTNVGGMCDDGNPVTEDDVCQADGTCVGFEGCPPPAVACTNGSENRRGCGRARTISRTSASTTWSIVDYTCAAYDEFREDDCWDANGDHTYRLYMLEGEQVNVRMQTWDPCDTKEWYWDGSVQIWQGSGCEDTGCSTRVSCDDRDDDITKVHTATQDGWVFIVADGSSAFGDEGEYTLTVTLTCRDGDCDCP